ncbi:MAG: ATP-dependent helicase/nuclease subunit B [Parasphingorhabdus sp.]
MITSQFTIELDTDSLIVVPSGFLNDHIQQDYNRNQLDSGNRTWPSLKSCSWANWATDCLESAVENSTTVEPTRLNAQQEVIVWERVIRNDVFRHAASAALIDISNLAQLAMRSATLHEDWQLEEYGSNDALNQDQRAFKRWHRQFKHHCLTRNLLPFSQQNSHLLSILDRFSLPDEHLCFYGFVAPSPIQWKIISALSKHTTVQCYCRIDKTQRISATQYASGDQELGSVLHTACDVANKNPQKQYAIVVDSQRQTVAAIQSLLRDRSRTNSPTRVRIHNSWALSDYPLVDDALVLLEAAINQQLSCSRFLQLLNSRFINLGLSEKQRLLIERVSRQSGKMTINGRCAYLFKRQPELVDQISRENNFLHAIFTSDFIIEKQSYIETAESFAAHLRKLGWPGHNHSSRNIRLSEQLSECLSNLGDLNLIQTEVSPRESLSRLVAFVNRPYRPGMASENVQVISPQQLNGCHFDTLWVVKLHNANWPRAENPDAFLALQIQRKAGIPSSNSELCADQANDFYLQLSHSAKQLHLSYSTIDDNDECSPASIARSLGFDQADNQVIPVTPQSVELIDDQNGVKLSSGPVRGGTGLLTTQSECPFKAYVSYRLGVEKVSEPDPGQDPRFKGQVIHAVLEQIWQQLGDKNALMEKTADQLTLWITELTAKQVAAQPEFRETGLGRNYMQLHSKLIAEQILSWLNLEKSRVHFNVLQTEQSITLELHGLQFKLRIDRIDRLENQLKLIIDYKTGTYKTPDIGHEHPTQLQLPAYALVNTEEECGVALAWLTPGQMKLWGIAPCDNADVSIKAFNKIKQLKNFTSWQELVNAWREHLESLAAAIKNGAADVQPRDSTVCKLCKYQSVCRIGEHRQ